MWRRLMLAGVVAALIGCGDSDPTGTEINIEGNTGPVTVIVPTGNNSAGSTAPCGAVATNQQNGPNQPTASGPDCSTVTPTPVVVTGGAS